MDVNSVIDATYPLTRGEEILSNLFYTMHELSEQASKMKLDPHVLTGWGPQIWDTVQRMEEKHGVEMTAEAVRRVWRATEHEQPWLYYPSGMYVDEQVEWGDRVTMEMQEVARKLEEELKNMEETSIEEEDEGIIADDFGGMEKPVKKKAKRPRYVSPRERADMVKVNKATSDDYRRLRRSLQQMISRREKAGVDMSSIKIPNIPKRITDASARELQRLINKINDAFRYLGGGRYRGM